MFSFNFNHLNLITFIQYFINYKCEFLIVCIGAISTVSLIHHNLKKYIKEDYIYLIKSCICVVLLSICICYLVGSSYNPFIYFRF